MRLYASALMLSVLLALALMPLAFDLGCAEPLSLKLLVLVLALVVSRGRAPWSPAQRILALWCGWGWLGALRAGLIPAWDFLWPLTLSLAWVRAAHRPSQVERAMLWGWLATVAYSWLQRLGLDPFPWSNPELSQLRTIAGLGNPNYLGMYLASLAPVAWSQLWTWGPGGWLLASLGLMALFLSLTRGAILALSLGLVLANLVGHRRASRKFWLLTWLLFGSCWILSGIYTRSTLSQPDEKRLVRARSQSVSTRLELWKGAARIALGQPLMGVGLGHFGDHYLLVRPPEIDILQAEQRRPEDPHNQLVQVTVETGLIGLGLWLLWLALALRSSPRPLCLVILTLCGLSNGFPPSLWPCLVWWAGSLEPGSPEPGKIDFRRSWWEKLALALMLALALASWKVQRDFWWDDEWALLGQHPSRLKVLQQTQLYCPPWYLAELERRTGQALAALGRWSEAIAWSRRRWARQPDNAFAAQALAGLLDDSGRLLEAQDLWARCHQLDPQNPVVLYHWARNLAGQGRWPEAQQRVEESLALNPESLQARYLLSWLHLQQGQAWQAYWTWLDSTTLSR